MVRDSAGHVLLSHPVAWTSSDPSVATIESEGPPGAHRARARLAAVGQGSVAIAVSSGAVGDTTRITVAGEVIIPYGSSGYRFKVVADSLRSGGGFELPDFDDVAAVFADGRAPFGDGYDFCPLEDSVQTTWPTGTDLLVRRTFNLPVGAGHVQLRVAIDNDLQVFLNGVDITATGEPNRLDGGFQRHGGCAERGSFVFTVPDTLVRAGSNLLAFRVRDRGVVSHFDLRVTAVPNN